MGTGSVWRVNMETKQTYIANINMVFGEDEEPLIRRVEDIILPALTAGIIRKASSKTNYIFQDVKLCEISENEWVIQGLLIKDTIVDIKSEYSKSKGLEKTDKQVKNAPYSLFIIYLKNHRMILVKNQTTSPDIRNFSSAFKGIIKEYVVTYNKNNAAKHENERFPFPTVYVTGIKTAGSVKDSLKDVEKINELVIKFFPLNAEWDYDSVFGTIDDKIRKTIQAKAGRMIFPSPKSKDGVADMIEATDGLVKTKMKVTYKNGTEMGDGGQTKTGTIKDNEISEIMNLSIRKELDNAFEEVHNLGKEIKALNTQTKNQIIDYTEFLNRYKR